MDQTYSAEHEEAMERESGNRRSSHFSAYTRRVAIAVGLAAAVAVLLMFLWTVAKVLLLAFAGLLLAVILHGLAKRLADHTPLPYGFSLAVVGILLAGALTLAVWFLSSRLATQFDQLSQAIPQAIDRIEQWVTQYSFGRRLVNEAPAPAQMFGSGSIWSRVTGVVSTTIDVLASIILILMVGVYLAVHPDLYRKGVAKLFPIAKRGRAQDVLDAVGGALWGWLTGAIISMTIVGVLTWFGLTLLGMPLALVLGVIAGLFEFVPLIGPWVAAIPAILVALLESPQQALYIALLYLAIQQLESNIITPLVMKEAVSLPPALTITATVTAGVLFGIPGVLIATPLTVAVMVLVQKVYIEGTLGDSEAAVPRKEPPRWSRTPSARSRSGR